MHLDGFEGAGKKVERTTVAVTLMDDGGKRVQAWELVEAFPVRWEGPQLAADANAVASGVCGSGDQMS